MKRIFRVAPESLFLELSELGAGALLSLATLRDGGEDDSREDPPTGRVAGGV